MPYNKRMTSFQKFGRGFSSAICKLALLALAFVVAGNMVFGKPDTLKTTLKDSGIYSGFTDSLIQQAKTDSATKPVGQDLPVQDPLVQEAIKKAITPEFAQSTAEQVVDGTYNWLEGKTSKPDFNVDLSGLKQNLANNVADAGVQRAQSLPVCTTQQLRQLDPNATDPFSLPCLPPGINLQAERQKLVNQTLTNGEFISDTSISADDLKDKGQTTSPFEKASYVPALFQWSQILPWILGSLVLVTGAGVILLDSERRRGIKSLSITLLITGGILAVSALIGWYFMRALDLNRDGLANTAQVQQSAVYIIRTLSGLFNKTLCIFAGIYIVLGGGGLLGLHFTKPKVSTPAPAKQPKPARTPEKH